MFMHGGQPEFALEKLEPKLTRGRLHNSRPPVHPGSRLSDPIKDPARRQGY